MLYLYIIKSLDFIDGHSQASQHFINELKSIIRIQ